MEEEFMNLTEAAKYLGIQRPSLYYYIKQLNIEVHRYKLNRFTYISKADVERVKQIRERPWELAEDTDKRPTIKPDQEAA